VPASFARRYQLSIALGVLVVAVLMGLRLWLDHRAEQPIVGPYKSFIDALAAASPEARSELQRYLAASGRDSVASQDFLPLCATMLRQAQAQDVKLELNMTLEQFHSIRTLCQPRRS
jgi:predicted negative regulator of RcsB-dependent stress response